MSYSTAIPASNDARSQSQGQILANFNAINTIWGTNHNGLTANTPQGYHSALTFRVQPNPTTSATQISIYTKLDTNSIPQLYFRPKSSGTPIQLTNHTPIDIGNSQSSFVAGPFIIYMGILNGPLTSGASQVTVTPASTLLYANVSAFGFQGNNRSAIATSVGSPANTFTISFQTGVTAPATGGVFYYAIGKP